MRSVEVTAKSREDAIDQGLRQLGVERDEIETEILQHGSKGIFGFGAKDWQLRVTTEAGAPASDRPKREGGRGRGRGRRGGGGQRDASGAKPRDSKRDESRPNKRENKRDNKPRSGGRRADADNKRSDRPERKPRSERAERQSRSDRPERRPRTERAEETPGAAEVAIAAAAGPRRSTEASDTEAAALLQEMIQLMGIQSEVSHVEDEDKNLRLAVSSEDSALLIGRKGRGLAALQYVINRVARGIEGRDETERIIVDVEGYLDRRKQSLEEMAVRMAERVKETGRRFSMRPMNPQERRVVHVALQEDEELRTFSVGDSAIRRVVIAPKDEEREERPRRRPQRDRNDRNRGRDDSSRASGNGNGSAADLDEVVDAQNEDFDVQAASSENSVEEIVAMDATHDDVDVVAEDTSAIDNIDDVVADDDRDDGHVAEPVPEVEEIAAIDAGDTDAVADDQSGNGESSDDADTAPPRRRRRSSTYKRGRR